MPCRAVSLAVVAAGAFVAGLLAVGAGGAAFAGGGVRPQHSEQPGQEPQEPERFAIVSESATVDPIRRQVEFELLFNQAPDLFTVDEFGRPAKSFQYEINPDYTGSPFEDPLASLRAIVRGDEVRAAGKLRVRNANTTPDPDPIAGGWGGLRGAVPLEIEPLDGGDGAWLRFTASYDLLKETEGVFAYRVFTTEFGETTSRIEATVIPLPPALWAGAAALGVAALAAAAARARCNFCIRR